MPVGEGGSSAYGGSAGGNEGMAAAAGPGVSPGEGEGNGGALGLGDGLTGSAASDAGATADAGSVSSDAGAGALPDASHAPDASSAPAPLDPALGRRLSALSSRLALLGERTSAFWFEHGPDTELGGFHGTLDRQGNPVAPEDKGLIQQTRHLWMLSTWCERRGATAPLLALARQQYSFVRDSFVDGTDGAFVYKVSRDGSRVVDNRKQMFAESYAIYALATYGRVLGDPEATALALRRFASIDQARHDAQNGGYDQRNDPGTLSVGAAKDTNTHLHLMEAFSALYEASGDPRVATRLNELVDLFVSRLRQPTGYVPAEFTLAWAPVGTPLISYGHNLETAWLLLEAARVLGRLEDPTLRVAALDIAETSAGPGFDRQRGGFFEAGPVGGAANDLDKVWWVQFEAMEGLWWAYELSADPTYLDQIESTLSWIERTEDLPVGEWFAMTNADGSAAGADYKSDEWKASYHTVRGLVFLKDWIDGYRPSSARLAALPTP
jgi:cellobiose epimerase